MYQDTLSHYTTESHDSPSSSYLVTDLLPLTGQRKFMNWETEDELEIKTHEMLYCMDSAWIEDEHARRREEPAIKKLKLLDKVLKFLKVPKYHNAFLSMNGCESVGRWLQLHPDGTSPSAPIKTGLLQALQHIKIETEHLNTSNLGKSVFGIWRNESEHISIRNLAKSLVHKWSRSIFDISTDYSNSLEFDSSVPLPRDSCKHFSIGYEPAQILKKCSGSSTVQRLQKKMKKRKRSKLGAVMSVKGKDVVMS
jgi:hypothetical protein